MSNLKGRFDALEAGAAKRSGSLEWYVLRIKDDGRGPFRAFTPGRDRIKSIPGSHSRWPDDSLVFDSLSNPPVGENDTDLSDEEWAELRAAESVHQKGIE